MPSVTPRPRASPPRWSGSPSSEPRIAELDADELDELEQLAVVGHGEYMTAAFTLRGQVRTRRQQLADAAANTPDPGDAGEDHRADDDSATAPADAKDPDGDPPTEDPDVDVDVDVDELATAAGDSDSEQQKA